MHCVMLPLLVKLYLIVQHVTAEALQAAAEVSSSSGRDAGSKNLVLGTSDSVAKWRQLDEKVRPVFASD